MKVMTVLGTRPEIIRLSQVIRKLDASTEHVLVHTGQNFTSTLSDVFFRELGVRAPDHHLGVRADSPGEQIGRIFIEGERVLAAERPDAILVLGDTNSGLVAVIARRLGIPVFHMEAGNRCYDDRVPEEINRRLIDHASNVLMPYTYRSKENLVREGIPRERIFVTGNPIFEVLEYHHRDIAGSDALARYGLSPQGYFLVTMHRAENVDVEHRLRSLLSGLQRIAAAYSQPVLCSLHPRTRSKMESFGIGSLSEGIRFVEPMGFFDFINLERQARCVLSDSGTVQEECAILGVPSVTVRDVTERPETIESGSNMLTGMNPDRIAASVALVLREPTSWQPPPEYKEPLVSSKVLKILLGYSHAIEGGC